MITNIFPESGPAVMNSFLKYNRAYEISLKELFKQNTISENEKEISEEFINGKGKESLQFEDYYFDKFVK